MSAVGFDDDLIEIERRAVCREDRGVVSVEVRLVVLRAVAGLDDLDIAVGDAFTVGGDRVLTVCIVFDRFVDRDVIFVRRRFDGRFRRPLYRCGGSLGDRGALGRRLRFFAVGAAVIASCERYGQYPRYDNREDSFCCFMIHFCSLPFLFHGYHTLSN